MVKADLLLIFELRRWHWVYDVALEAGLDPDDAAVCADLDHAHYTQGRGRMQ